MDSSSSEQTIAAHSASQQCFQHRKRDQGLDPVGFNNRINVTALKSAAEVVVNSSAPLWIRTVAVGVTDVDVVDVRVRLQREHQADEIRGWEQDRDRVHQRPETPPESQDTAPSTPKR